MNEKELLFATCPYCRHVNVYEPATGIAKHICNHFKRVENTYFESYVFVFQLPEERVEAVSSLE